MKYELDATGRALGRVASEAAVLLQGKQIPSYRPHELPRSKVTITNISKIKAFSLRKQKTKHYVSYSGYPGGKKEKSLEYLLEKNGYTSVLRVAISGMLPKNKLKKVMMQNLSIVE